MDNPLVVDVNGQSWGGIFLDDENLFQTIVTFCAGDDAEEVEYFKQIGLTVGFMADWASENGYDGLICKNAAEENNMIATQYVVFNPNNIKIERRESYELK